MGKSVIPFIFGNPYLNDIFIEVAGHKNVSELFYFEISNLNRIKTKKTNTLLTDNSFLNDLLNDRVKVKNIILIDDLNVNTSNYKVYAELVKLNIPFKMVDLYQRIENDLIQSKTNDKRILKYKYLIYDPSIRKLSNKSLSLRFTEKESQIFLFLLENRNSYVSKKDLLLNVWSYGSEIDTHTLETHVYALRKKIESSLKVRDLIMFEEKKGYFLNDSIL